MQITQIFAIIIFLVSVLAFNNKVIFNKYLYSPYLVWQKREWYRILTAGFIHSNWVHLLINLFVFWEFGSFLESAYVPVLGKMGSMIFLASLFLGGVVFANIPALFRHQKDMYFRSIGASGGNDRRDRRNDRGDRRDRNEKKED